MMGFFKKLKKICANLWNSKHHKVSLAPAEFDLKTRIDRLERNYIILLKRVLELDGVQLVSKTNAFSNKVLRTSTDELGKGLSEPEPTLH